MKLLVGKTVLVTGAGAGIGRGCALELARHGARVVVNDRPGAGSAAQVSEEVRSLGTDSLAVEADVFDPAGAEQLVSTVLGQWQTIDILVSCPAASIRKPFVDYDPKEFLHTVNATFLSHAELARLVARHMVARGVGGKILFISSIRSFLPFARSAAYNAAKAALNQMAFTMANELAVHRINVNVIEPGWIDTPGERLFASEADLQAAGPTLPWGRFGRPDDIGKAAAFLVSDEADYITGASLRVDGGIWMRNLCR